MTRVVVRLACWSTVVALALFAPRGAVAQDTTASVNHLYDKFQASLAFTAVLNRSNARLDGTSGRGTELNVRDRLGVSGTSIQPAIGIRWKPGRHTEFDLGYQFINQSGDKSTSLDSIIIGDDTLSGDINLKTKLGSDNATFQFKYSILAKEKYNVGLALGLGAIFFDVNFDGTATGCVGPDCASGSFNYSKQLVGPTASLGAFGRWRVADRWYVGADARGVGAKVDRFDFSVFEGDVSGQYFLSDRWGLDLAWYYTDVSVDVGAKSGSTVAEDLVGKISFNYSSIRLAVIAVF
jgi:hypothetical protein